MHSNVLDNQNSSYSTEILIRYAFNHEVQNRLKISPDAANDPKTQAIIEYMEARIQEIAKKFK